MLRKYSFLLACNLFLVAALCAQEAQKEKKLLQNADILLMVQKHFDDETLVKLIEASDTDFDISGESLVALKDQGVSSTVIRAMVQAVQRNKLAAAAPPASPVDTAPAPPAPSAANADTPALLARKHGAPRDPRSMMQSMGIDPQQLAALQQQLGALGAMGLGGMSSIPAYSAEQMPQVYLMDEPLLTEKHEISPSTAQIAQTKFKSGASGPGGSALRSLATEGLSFAAMAAGPAGIIAMSAFSMGSGFMPGMGPGAPSMTYVWGLPGRKSDRELANAGPIFQLSYGEIPGVDPDAFEPAVVKLVQTKDNYRLVGATRTKMDRKNMMSGMAPENGKWVSEERWPTHLDKEERGFYVLRVDQPLEPGEYAIVLRPVKGYKATPSAFGGAAQVFYSVWDFSVPGAPSEETGKKKKK